MDKLAPANEPWTLIRDAIVDLEEQEAQPGVEIDMDVWLCAAPSECSMCLGGAVMASRLIDMDVRDAGQGWAPEDFPEFCSRLTALDYFRTGDVEEGLFKLGLTIVLDHPDTVRVFTPASYNDDSELFKKDMLAMADYLESIKDKISSWRW